MPSDEELAAELGRGDDAALRALLHRYQRPLAHFIFRHTGGSEVEDIYQETWLRVSLHAANFDPEKRFSTWLFQIALNLCRDFHRRSRSAGELDAELRGTSSELDRCEAALEAGALLAQLPEAQREVLILRYYHDLSEEETGRVLDCPKGTVKSRMHNALARLAELARRAKS